MEVRDKLCKSCYLVCVVRCRSACPQEGKKLCDSVYNGEGPAALATKHKDMVRDDRLGTTDNNSCAALVHSVFLGAFAG